MQEQGGGTMEPEQNLGVRRPQRGMFNNPYSTKLFFHNLLIQIIPYSRVLRIINNLFRPLPTQLKEQELRLQVIKTGMNIPNTGRKNILSHRNTSPSEIPAPETILDQRAGNSND